MTDLAVVRLQYMLDRLRDDLDMQLGVKGLQRLYVNDEIDLEEFETRVARVLVIE